MRVSLSVRVFGVLLCLQEPLNVCVHEFLEQFCVYECSFSVFLSVLVSFVICHWSGFVEQGPGLVAKVSLLGSRSSGCVCAIVL